MRTALWPHYEVRGNLDQVQSLVVAFFAKRAWNPSVQKGGPHAMATVKARTTREWFTSGPAKLDWRLTQNTSTSTVIECRAHIPIPSIAVVHTLIPPSILLVALAMFEYDTRSLNILAKGFGLIGSIIIATMIGRWLNDERNATILNEFRTHAAEELGHPVTIKHQGVSKQASAGLLATYWCIFVVGALKTLLLHHEARRILQAPFTWMCLLLLALMTAIITNGQLGERLRHAGPYLVGAALISIYCSWHAITDLVGNNHRLLILIILDTGALIILWSTIKSMKVVDNSARFADENETRASIITAQACTVTLWIIVLASQITTIPQAINHLREHRLLDSIPEVLWLAPFITAYTLMAKRAITSAAKLRNARRTTPQSLRDRCAELARDLDTTAPPVALTDEGDSYVEQPIIGPRILCLNEKQLARLNPNHQDALILHELYHCKKHRSVITIIERLSAIVLCGRGLLSTIIDTKAIEYEADHAAMTALNNRGLPGKKIVTGLVWALSTQAIKNASANEHSTTTYEQNVQLTTTRLINELIFGDEGLWYRHPTIEERTAALETVCHA